MRVDVSVEFESGNAAFEQDPKAETVRILREVATKIEASQPDEDGEIDETELVRDINGNAIGRWHFNVSADD